MTHFSNIFECKPNNYEWWSTVKINFLNINMRKNISSEMFNLFLPRRPIFVNSLTLDNIEELSMMNTLLKIYFQPLKSLCLNFTHENR